VPATLVRPDGYVAWAGDASRGQALDDAVHEALTVHCGAPAGA
jgi:hypothetical protein